MQTQGEMAICKPRRETLKETSPADTLILDFQPSELWGNKFLLFMPVSLWHFCYGMRVKLTQLCPTLCDPMGHSPPISSVHGILQARILKWVVMPSSRGSSQPRDQTCTSYISCIGRQVLYHWHHLGNPLWWQPELIINKTASQKGHKENYSHTHPVSSTIFHGYL